MMIFMFIKLLLFLIVLYVGFIGLGALVKSFKEPTTDKKLDKELDKKKEQLENVEAKNRTLTQEVEVTKQLKEAEKEFASKQEVIETLDREIEDE